MDFQTIFYVLASVLIIGWLLFLILLMLAAWLIFRRVVRLSSLFEAKISSPMSSMTAYLLPVAAFLLALIQRWRGGKRKS